MLKIGLTGGIGSGKSTVASIFENMGFKIIDADQISRDVLIKYAHLNEEIKTAFGEPFFCGDDRLNRKKLGEIIFKNPNERIKLEKIIMPYIIKEIFIKFNEYNETGVEVCILDAPTLIEQGLSKEMDFNILVLVDRNIQIERIKQRDSITEEQIKDRINAQMSLEERKKYVDFIIDNNGDINYTKEQVNYVLKQIMSSV